MYNPQLDTFAQVAASRSFSAAAQALYVTPTAVIKQTNLLEARLGVKLFNRSHHDLTLMLLQRGGNEDLDRFRREIWLNHPQITVDDFPQYKAEVFNTCASEGYAIASLDLWKDAQPMLRTLPVA